MPSTLENSFVPSAVTPNPYSSVRKNMRKFKSQKDLRVMLVGDFISEWKSGSEILASASFVDTAGQFVSWRGFIVISDQRPLHRSNHNGPVAVLFLQIQSYILH